MAAFTHWDAPPPAPPPDEQRLVGLYGGRRAQVSIFEQDGMLFAEGSGFSRSPLGHAQRGVHVVAQQNHTGESGSRVLKLTEAWPLPFVTIGEDRLDRRDFDAEAAAFAQAPKTIPTASVSRTKPPIDDGSTLPNDLISILDVAPGVRLDIRYASANNFMGFALYERAVAFLQRPATEALGRVQASVARQGYGLIVHDAYRPWSITRLFWEAIPVQFRAFVANPALGSKHNRGCAVDVTLCDLATGAAVDMPGRYDEASRRSYADYTGGTTRQRWFRDRLREEMEVEGFAVQPEEWWHFDFKDWRNYPVSDIALSELSPEDSTPALPRER